MNLSATPRPKRSKADFWSRFEALEKGLRELQHRRPDIAIKTMIEAILMLLQSPEWRQIAGSGLKIPLRLDKWPKSFARILIDAGVKCDESRREAVRRYVVILEDLQRHEKLLHCCQPDQCNDWSDSVTRWRR